VIQTEAAAMSAQEQGIRWWLNTGQVHGYVHGVFEGGGAKGVLYAGALEAVLRRGLWFSAAAGSSAGAITAAMIAAGMDPTDIGAETERGLRAMATPTKLNAMRRIRWGTGFLDHAGVLSWLRTVLCDRVRIAGGTVDERGPSFMGLFDLTGIDLFVAAVDLTARQVVVFHHSLTPRVRVAEAVMASATIPVAFEPLWFGDRWPWRLFVDGGVASNYPAFVYQDEAFRRYSRLGEHSSDTPIVGFLLDEEAPDGRDVTPDEEAPDGRDATADVYGRGDFRGPLNDTLDELREVVDSRSNSSEPTAEPETSGPTESGQVSADPDVPVDAGHAWPSPARHRPRFRPGRVRPAGRKPRGISWVGHRVSHALGLALLWIFAQLGRLASRESDRDLWQWNDPKNPEDPKNQTGKFAVLGFRRWLAVAPVQLILGIAGYSIIFWFGFVVAATAAARDLAQSSPIGIVLGGAFELTVFGLAAFVWLLGLGTFLLSRLLYRTAGAVAPGVLRTYLDTSAPPWAGWGKNEHLIRLEVPPQITTLRVAEGAPLSSLISRAEEATFAGLEGVTGGPWPTTKPAAP
jgi:predicted acylesterase/phospholipase RssA